jgi:uroporphyrinogen III methyltransferase/synthase
MGNVSLIGAGLGGKAGLTLRAWTLLQQADLVLVDGLVDPSLLQELPACVQVIVVGKRQGQEGLSQADVNQLLLKYAQSEQSVVRLKSGDPLIFGRALQEIEALQQAGIDFEVVPGLSSALTGPCYAGIPLTHPDLSATLTILTAHDLERLPWDALVAVDTLVILMGTQNLVQIGERLLQAGRASETPMAVIRQAGQVDQQVWQGILGQLPQDLAHVQLAPAVIVVGEVVDLRSQIQPHVQLPPCRPLSGQTVLVTRAADQASDFTELLQRQGARVWELPTLSITPPSSWEPLDQAIVQLSRFDWLILTSANAVTSFFERLQVAGKDSRALAGVQVAVVGTKTAMALAQFGIQPDLSPETFVADALLESLIQAGELQGQRILFPRVESGGREVLVQGLRDQGAEVSEIPAYESACPQEGDASVLRALREKSITVVTFASSKTVQHFVQLLSQADLDLQVLEEVVIAAIGPKTADTCTQLLGRVDVVPQQYTLPDLTQALVRHFRGGRVETLS